MKKILLITTGGTIASRETAFGLAPSLGAQALLRAIPEIRALCTVESVSLFHLDSTNMSHSHWLAIASCIQKKYDEYDGFVVTHGTDTMAYTSSALSYLVRNSPKPIVLTGSQKPARSKNTDARTNLTDAFRFACDERVHGVYIVFDGKAIFGTRAKKQRTKSYNAFSSIDYPYAGVVRDGRVKLYIEETEIDGPIFSAQLEPRVFVLGLVPGLSPSIFSWLKEHYEAVIIESFGVGGIPTCGDMGLGGAVENWIAGGKTLVMATRVTHEGSDLSIYQVGKIIKEKFRLIEAFDMTHEAVYTKLMWILGQSKDPVEVRKLFYTPIHKDIM